MIWWIGVWLLAGVVVGMLLVRFAARTKDEAEGTVVMSLFGWPVIVAICALAAITTALCRLARWGKETP